MKRITTGLLAALLLAGTVVGCSKSYDETVEDCISALKERPKGDTGKPDACKDVKDEDYTAIVMGQVLDENGWVDENGDVDMGELIEDSTAQP